MLNKRAFKLFLTVIFSLLATVSIVSAQEVTAEPPTAAVPQIGTVLSFPLIENGKPLSFNFLETDGAVLRAFDATKGDLVTMSVKKSGDVYASLTVFSSSGLLLAHDHGMRDMTVAESRITDLQIPADGRYFLYVSNTGLEHYTAPDWFQLDTKVSVLVEGNHRPAEMKEDDLLFLGVNATIGDSFDVAISKDASAYYVLFDGEKGQKLTLDAVSKKLDTSLALFDTSGHRVMMNEDEIDFKKINAHIEVELPQTGTYFLIVTTFEFVAIANQDGSPVTGTITLSIQE